MIKIIDSPRVNRNAMLANVASVGGLLLLMASVALPMFYPSLSTLSLVLMALGLGSAMVGIYFANRWVRKPRPEEQIDVSLKGLGDSYAICHFPRLPIDHILVTPTGILVLETIAYQGMFVFQDGKWKENMTMGRAIRYVVEEHLGDPSRTVESAILFLKEKLALENLGGVPVRGLVLFTHPAAILDLKNPPIPVCRIDKLRKHVDVPGAKLDPGTIQRIVSYLESVTK